MAINEKKKNPFATPLQLDKDLPDFVTTFDHDPGNLNLKLKHLDTSKWIHYSEFPLPPPKFIMVEVRIPKMFSL